MRKRKRRALYGVEDVRRDHGTPERRPECHDAPGVGRQVVVEAQGEGRVRDEPAHGVGDEDETPLAFVARPAAGRGVGGMPAPLLQMLAGLRREEPGVDLDGQPPVVGERQHRVGVGDRLLDGPGQLVVRLDAPQDRAPRGDPQQPARPDAPVLPGLFRRGEMEGARPSRVSQAFASHPGRPSPQSTFPERVSNSSLPMMPGTITTASCVTAGVTSGGKGCCFRGGGPDSSAAGSSCLED